jgi:hypothetical protein
VANVRLVIYDAGTLSAEETLLRNRLQTQGHTVTLQHTATQPSPWPAATQWDLVVVARSSWYTDSLPASYLDVPQVNLQRFSWPAMGFDSVPGAAYSDATTELHVHDAAHPVAAGKSGTVTMATQGVQWRAFSTPAESLQTVWKYASWAPNNSGGVHVVDDGATLLGGKTAGARMVVFGQANTDTLQHLTSNWWDVFDSAVVWALGGEGGSTQLDTPSGLTFFASGALQVTAQWQAVVGASSYEWQMEVDNAGWQPFSNGAVSQSPLVVSSGITAGTSYRVRVRAMPGGA